MSEDINDKRTTLQINSDWPSNGVKSLSNNNIHKLPAQYLAELIMVNGDSSLLEEGAFWNKNPYKKRYTSLMVHLQRRLKYCDFKYIHNVIVKYKLTTFGTKEIDELITKEIEND